MKDNGIYTDMGKLVGFGSDGASNMVGVKHGLVTLRLRDFLSFVYVIQLFVFLMFNILWSEANKLYIIFTNLESFFQFFPLCRTDSVEVIHAQHQVTSLSYVLSFFKSGTRHE
jgi:hypothetical protein